MRMRTSARMARSSTHSLRTQPNPAVRNLDQVYYKLIDAANAEREARSPKVNAKKRALAARMEAVRAAKKLQM